MNRMTNKEAIKILQVAKAEIEWSAPFDYQEALDMAIEALKKQLPSIQPEPCEEREKGGCPYYAG